MKTGRQSRPCFQVDMVLSLTKRTVPHGFKRIEGILPTETVCKYRLFIDGHRVLAREYPEGIFIADGTAGQIDDRYLTGYYDFSVNAPRKLKLFYTNAIRRWREEDLEKRTKKR
jgi:hypothetical protein